MGRETEKNSLKPTKGNFRGYKWIIFDAAPECQGEACAIFNQCPYANVGKCTVETKYCSAVFDTIIEDIGEKLSQKLLNKISLHLMPLFGQLVKFKKIELSVSDPVIVMANGRILMHPIYEEIRKVISSIERTQRSMGIDGEYMEVKEMWRGRGDGATLLPDEGPPVHGDANWVTQMSEMEKEEVKREIFPDGQRSNAKRRRLVDDEDR